MMDLLVFIGLAGAFYPLMLVSFALDKDDTLCLERCKYHGHVPKI